MSPNTTIRLWRHTNPSFENKTTGWSVTKQVSGWESFDTWSDRPAADGTFFVSLCYQNITSIDLHQSVSGLPAGTYTLEASLRNTAGANFLTDQRIYAEADGVLSESDQLTQVSGTGNNDWYRFSVADVELPEGKPLRLGVRSTGTGSGTKGWFQADDFRLYYWGAYRARGIELPTTVPGAIVKERQYFSLDGTRLSAPQPGFNIVKEILMNGQVKISKAFSFER